MEEPKEEIKKPNHRESDIPKEIQFTERNGLKGSEWNTMDHVSENKPKEQKHFGSQFGQRHVDVQPAMFSNFEPTQLQEEESHISKGR